MTWEGQRQAKKQKSKKAAEAWGGMVMQAKY